MTCYPWYKNLFTLNHDQTGHLTFFSRYGKKLGNKNKILTNKLFAGDVQQYMKKFNSEAHWPLGTPVEPLAYIIAAVSSGSGDSTGSSSAWKNWKLYSSAKQCIIWAHYFNPVGMMGP